MHYNEGIECPQTNGIHWIVIYCYKRLPLDKKILECLLLYVFWVFFKKLPFSSPSFWHREEKAVRLSTEFRLNASLYLQKQEVGSFTEFNEGH